MSRPRRFAIRRTAALVCAAAATIAAVVGGAPAAGAAGFTVSPTGKLLITMRGNGHGHGMSQYGARGAAMQGLSYAQILGFYYPGAKLTTLANDPLIRVRLSSTGTTTTIAAAPGTEVSGYGTLPSAAISRYRLVAGSGVALGVQALGTAPGSTWKTLKWGLPDGSQFHHTNWSPVRVYLTDGTSTDYYGRIRAVRANPSGRAGGVSTIDVLGFDRYAAGVVPQEMPTSWERAAVDAQTVAARTYGAYAVAHPSSGDYDICDSTMCQVYGGHAHYDRAGNVVDRDYEASSTATARRVLTYQGSPIFAQFAASNGGWTVAGGQPYLKAESDPYDASASGDPYINYTKTVTVKSVADYFGLAKLTKLVITSRDGNGTWGGRVTGGYVQGTDSSGKAKTVDASGFDFQYAFGIGTTWFSCKPVS
jgi:SpoIID/LytB domain protein